MQRDGQRVLVDGPELLEDRLGLRARVDEDERRLRALDGGVDFVDRMPRAVARPGQALARVEHGEVRRGAGRRDDKRGHRPRAGLACVLRDEIAAQFIGIAHGGGKPCGREPGRDRAQARKIEREQVAALGGDERVQFVEHDALQRAEQMRRVGAAQQQRELFGRRHQNVGRIAALALAARGGRVAGARFDAHRQVHVDDGRFEIARDVDRERLQRRDVERVHAGRAIAPARAGQIDEAGQEARQRLARAGGRDEQRALPVAGQRQQVELMTARAPAARGEPACESFRQWRLARAAGHRRNLGARESADQTRAHPGPASLRVEASSRTATLKPWAPASRSTYARECA